MIPVSFVDEYIRRELLRPAREAIDLDHHLSFGEWALLNLLIKHRGTVSYEACSRAIASERCEPSVSSAMTIVSRLRQKLTSVGVAITTERGVGYTLRAEDRRRLLTLGAAL